MRLPVLACQSALVASITTSALLGVQNLTHAEQLSTSSVKVPEITSASSLSAYMTDAQSDGFQVTAPTFSDSTVTFQGEAPIMLAQFSAPVTLSPEQVALDVAPQVQLTAMNVASADTKQIQDVTTSSEPNYGFSYIGGGLNIGLGSGRTGLGQTSFAIISKIGFTNYLSFRPSILFTDNLTVLLPVTYDFRGRRIAGATVLPFLGAGVAAATRGSTSFELLFTGGVDVPVSKEITITGSLNATVTGGSSIGLLLGVAYNFE
ncbi:MAG: hypothetical protein NZ772_03315 [Cyanobacteria bacterium]|nr:hypothetical protein [Cyanobacteriota bacterium]MDW8200140.1 hypothetical protein [Cyanobacteriota bacterium SKYGB_h_bin112]